MAETVLVNKSHTSSLICGINDRNIPYLEALFSSDIFVKGNMITIEKDGTNFTRLIKRLEELAKGRKEEFSETEIFMEYQSLDEPLLTDLLENKEKHINSYSIVVNGKSIYPKSINQKEYISSLFENQIIFGTGPAGTGKTFIAIAYALMMLISGKKQKLILTRPVVEAGESLGFLPGDLSQKLNPYLRPLYDSMEYFITPAQVKRLEDAGSIEIAPLAYMRGRSLSNAIVILDEAQNTTIGQMKMFLTRLSENSQAIITGDLTQIDLPRRTESGLKHSLNILNGINDLSMVTFSSTDVIRSRIVRAIVNAYEREENIDAEKKNN